MNHAGLAHVAPADSINYSNAHRDKNNTSNKPKFKRRFNKKKSHTKTSNAGGSNSQLSRPNSKSKNKRKCPICDEFDHFAYQCPHLEKARSSVKKSRPSKSSWGTEGDDEDIAAILDDQTDCAFSAFASPSSNSGIVDSGSTAMILQSKNIDLIRNLSPSSRSIATADSGGSLSIFGEGTCGSFDKVLVSDQIRENIISVSRLADRGIDTLFTKDSVKLIRSDTGVIIATGRRDGGLYRLPL